MIVACDEIWWNGVIFDSTGTYYDTLQTQTGCDSVVTLNLTIHNSVNTDTAIMTACDSAEWEVTVYDSSGLYI